MDELLIRAGSPDGDWGNVATVTHACFWTPHADSTAYNPEGGFIRVNPGTSVPGDVDKLRHVVGSTLGLVSWPPRTGLKTEDGKYFTGPRALQAYRTGGGDPSLPGVPLALGRGHGSKWDVGSELMGWSPRPCGTAGMVLDEPDGLSLAALADAGCTVDMSKATPWRKPENAVVATAGKRFRDVVVMEIVEPPRPGGGPSR